jgi:hypothetical protein
MTPDLKYNITTQLLKRGSVKSIRSILDDIGKIDLPW